MNVRAQRRPHHAAGAVLRARQKSKLEDVSISLYKETLEEFGERRGDGDGTGNAILARYREGLLRVGARVRVWRLERPGDGLA